MSRRQLMASVVGLGVLTAAPGVARGKAGSVSAPACQVADMGPFEIVYKSQPPLNDPRSHYPGFRPGVTVLPKGFTDEPGRMAFETDTVYDQDVAVRLRDGTIIYIDVYRPVTSEPVPAIVSYGPAGKRGQNNMLDDWGAERGCPPRMTVPKDALSGRQAWESPDPAHWVPHGYALVNVDVRGSYSSQGDLAIFGPQNGDDGYDVIEFLAKQPWCSGKVAMAGNSWYAMVQMLVASRRPPHLVAIAPWECEDDIYRDEYVRDGIPISRVWDRAFGPGRLEDMAAMVQKYPLKNGYWNSKLFDIEQIEIPTYMVASYNSQIHALGSFRGFNRLASKEKWLRVHNTHEWPDQYRPENRADLLRFFDHYLKGSDNGWPETAKVRLSVFDPGGNDIVGRAEDSFPLAREKARRLYLNPHLKRLSDTQPRKAGQIAYDSESEDGMVAFEYMFDQDTEITGFLTARLWVEARSATDMDVFARVLKLSDTGDILFQDSISYQYSGPDGRLRVSHRELDTGRTRPGQVYHTHRKACPIAPGQIVPIDIQFWPTGLIFHKGQGLRLVVAGFDYMPSKPADRPPPAIFNKGIHVIHAGGKYDSWLHVPFIPQGRT